MAERLFKQAPPSKEIVVGAFSRNTRNFLNVEAASRPKGVIGKISPLFKPEIWNMLTERTEMHFFQANDRIKELPFKLNNAKIIVAYANGIIIEFGDGRFSQTALEKTVLGDGKNEYAAVMMYAPLDVTITENDLSVDGRKKLQRYINSITPKADVKKRTFTAADYEKMAELGKNLKTNDLFSVLRNVIKLAFIIAKKDKAINDRSEEMEVIALEKLTNAGLDLSILFSDPMGILAANYGSKSSFLEAANNDFMGRVKLNTTLPTKVNLSIMFDGTGGRAPAQVTKMLNQLMSYNLSNLNKLFTAAIKILNSMKDDADLNAVFNKIQTNSNSIFGFLDKYFSNQVKDVADKYVNVLNNNGMESNNMTFATFKELVDDSLFVLDGSMDASDYCIFGEILKIIVKK